MRSTRFFLPQPHRVVGRRCSWVSLLRWRGSPLPDRWGWGRATKCAQGLREGDGGRRPVARCDAGARSVAVVPDGGVPRSAWPSGLRRGELERLPWPLLSVRRYCCCHGGRSLLATRPFCSRAGRSADRDAAGSVGGGLLRRRRCVVDAVVVRSWLALPPLSPSFGPTRCSPVRVALVFFGSFWAGLSRRSRDGDP